MNILTIHVLSSITSFVATVQAALGPVCLKRLMSSDNSENKVLQEYANVVLTVCILSIIVTAPLGAILISVTGTKLLTKTKQLPPTDGNFHANTS